MIFGTVFHGQIKTQNSQYIETKFFCFILPLYASMSMLVTDISPDGGRVGMEIKKSWTSIIATIMRVLLSIASVFAIGSYLGNMEYEKWAWLIYPAIIVPALTIYFWFFFGRTTKYEEFVRDQIGENTEHYFMPEWLYERERKIFYDKLQLDYLKYVSSEKDWKEKLKTLAWGQKEFSLCYALTALENADAPNPETKILLKEVYQREKVNL